LGAKKIFEDIYRLNRKLGITIVLVEHRLDLTAKYANRIIIMDEGKIVLDGEPRKILVSEEVHLMGIGIPKVIRLYQFLKQRGKDLGEPPLSSEEIAKKLRERLGR